jgi:DNA (cytosine-5)-methyltransferase 1
LKLLDLFCGAGGAGMGYHLAGFQVVGVDISPMPRYPFEFHQADALEFLALHGSEFDVIHASPPCQRYSAITHAKKAEYMHPDLIPITREMLQKTGKPYVIENVPRAPLVNPLVLCGTMFGLHVIRHRLFECNPAIYFRHPCQCKNVHTQIGGKHGFLGGTYQDKMQGFITVIGATYSLEVGQWAMGIDWMSRKELSQAIPPAYTKYIGGLLLANTALLSNTTSSGQVERLPLT